MAHVPPLPTLCPYAGIGIIGHPGNAIPRVLWRCYWPNQAASVINADANEMAKNRMTGLCIIPPSGRQDACVVRVMDAVRRNTLLGPPENRDIDARGTLPRSARKRRLAGTLRRAETLQNYPCVGFMVQVLLTFWERPGIVPLVMQNVHWRGIIRNSA